MALRMASRAAYRLYSRVVAHTTLRSVPAQSAAPTVIVRSCLAILLACGLLLVPPDDFLLARPWRVDDVDASHLRCSLSVWLIVLLLHAALCKLLGATKLDVYKLSAPGLPAR